MAVKSWYLTVVETGTNKKVFDKLFFTAPVMNQYIKEDYIVKENY